MITMPENLRKLDINKLHRRKHEQELKIIKTLWPAITMIGF